MSNLILIGFKASGKTTLGRSLAERLKKRFIDTDDLLGQKPSVLYENLKEDRFRDLEEEVIRSLQNVQDCVIATGGGVILREENRQMLRLLGIVLFLHTPKEEIKKRILSAPKPSFFKEGDFETEFEMLYQNRLGIYESMAHHSVMTEDDVWQVMNLDPFSK